MKILILLCVLFLNSFANAQQRIGIDLSSRMTDMNISISYHKVVMKNYLISGGVHFGNFGKSFMDRYSAKVPFESLESPFTGRPNSIIASNETYKLHQYRITNNALGMSFGVGVFKEFSLKHGVRFNLNSKFLFVTGSYKLEYGRGGEESIWEGGAQNNFVGAISPEIVHTIRLSGRITFYYGIKAPYFYSLDKGKFHPLYSKDRFNGFEPELSIGITRVFGKC